MKKRFLLLALCTTIGVQIRASLPTYSGGDGKQSTPYLISNVTDLSTLAAAVSAGQSYAGEYFELTDNLVLSNFIPIGTYDMESVELQKPFCGTFDGGNFKISGTIGNAANNFQGLFGGVGTDGVVMNLAMDATVSGTQYVGAVAGGNLGTISNCYNSGAVSGQAMIGGVLGVNVATLTNCYNAGVITGFSNVGGVVGLQDAPTSSLSNCLSIGLATSNGSAGGVLGWLTENAASTVSNCYYNTDIQKTSISIAGVMGKTSQEMLVPTFAATISNSFAHKTETNDAVYFPYLLSFGDASAPSVAKFILTFHINDGVNNTVETQAFLENFEQKLSANTFTRDGYSFVAWNTQADGKGTSYSDEQAISIDADMPLYAIWAEGFTHSEDFGYELQYTINDDNTLTLMGLAAGEVASDKNLVILPTITYDQTDYDITHIADSAFYKQTGFAGGLHLSNKLISIGAGAFNGCSGFVGSLNIFPSTTTIGGGAFLGCASLSGNLYLPSTVTSLGEGAFAGCSGFKGELSMEAGVSYIPYAAFMGTGFSSVNIDAVIDSISSAAFLNCTKLSGALNLPVNLTFIGDAAFENCEKLSGTLVLPSQVAYIGNSAFKNCQDFTGVLSIPESVEYIGNAAFASCVGFNDQLCIGDNVVTIGNASFVGCSGFTDELIIPNSVTGIGAGAFDGCVGFNALNLGNSIDSIGNGAFTNCTGFAGNLDIPNSVKTIGAGAFFNCSTFVDTLYLGSGIISMGDGAFTDCEFTAMKSLAVNPPVAEDGTFGALPGNIQSVMVPNATSAAAYKLATGWSSFNFNKFSITFNANEGDGSMINLIFMNGVAENLPENDFTRENYSFSSWNTQADGNGTEYAAGAEVNPMGDMTLYAIWEIATSMNAVQKIAPFTSVKNTLYFTQTQYISVYNIAGGLIYSGNTNMYNLPHAGMFMICTDKGNFKTTAIF